jgi:peroxiredoxin
VINKEETPQPEEVSSLSINTSASVSHPAGTSLPGVDARLAMSGPASGHHLGPFALPDAAGRTVQLWQFLQRYNVVLFFHHGVGCAACRGALQELATHMDAFSQEETAVLAVGPDQLAENKQLADQIGHPFPFLSDPTGQTVIQQGLATPSLVIADRWGEIWAAWAVGTDHRLPSSQDILQWLVFIESQCPECTMIEWTEQGEDS